jgi:hypothetical protein
MATTASVTTTSSTSSSSGPFQSKPSIANGSPALESAGLEANKRRSASGLWIVFPAYLIYNLSYELVESLAGPANAPKKVDLADHTNVVGLLKSVTGKKDE